MLDKSDVLDIINEFPEQIKQAVKIAKKSKIKISGKIKNVVVCGVGVAGNAADMCSALTNKVPIFSCKDYKVPNFVNKNSLVIALSYSGKSDETISAYRDAKRKKAKILLITGNKDLAKKEKNNILIPEKLIPRFSLAYLLMPAVIVLSSAKIISNPNMGEIARVLNKKDCSRKGFLISKKLKGKIPLIYSSAELYPAAYRIKCSLNEKSKQVCFSGLITDVVYNETLTYKKFPRRYEIVLLKNDKDNPGVRKHMAMFKKTMKNKNITEFEIKGNSVLTKMLYGNYVGDYLAYYLALMNKEDPFNIKMIHLFKEFLQ